MMISQGRVHRKARESTWITLMRECSQEWKWLLFLQTNDSNFLSAGWHGLSSLKKTAINALQDFDTIRFIPQQQHNTKVIRDHVGGPHLSLAAAPANYNEHDNWKCVRVGSLGSVFTWPKWIIIFLQKLIHFHKFEIIIIIFMIYNESMILS
jgi:hypothetical protein